MPVGLWVHPDVVYCLGLHLTSSYGLSDTRHLEYEHFEAMLGFNPKFKTPETKTCTCAIKFCCKS